MRASYSASDLSALDMVALHSSVGTVIDCIARESSFADDQPMSAPACLATPDDPSVVMQWPRREVDARTLDLFLRVRRERKKKAETGG